MVDLEQVLYLSFFTLRLRLFFNKAAGLYSLSYALVIVIIKSEQKRKFSIKDFFSKCDQIRRKLQI